MGAPGQLQTKEGRATFLENAFALEKLLSAWSPLVAAGGQETVTVLVPKLSKDAKKKKHNKGFGSNHGVGDGVEDAAVVSTSKRGFNRRKVTVASLAAAEAEVKAKHAKEDKETAKQGSSLQELTDVGVLKARGKSGSTTEELEGVLGAIRNGVKDGWTAEELQPLVPQVVCRLCSAVEVVGSEKESRMLSCQKCCKRFHRKCLKHWAEYRDLFNWASWVCASCRSCEICNRTGEPNKLMFCKRCDGAYHAYCQHPALKHVPKGPYLCPKHTRCHSCASNLPGSGVSSRWFLAYTSCDACGRLFMKDKYCPVCLKVYRDSEATPMVCCDSCEHWVHCRCDGISDEKFHQFQADDNLRYKCAACRGECFKVKNLEEAVWELWKRREENDAKEKDELRAAAGLPSEEELQKLCPSSDDEKQLPPFNKLSIRPKSYKKLGKRPTKLSKKSAPRNIPKEGASPSETGLDGQEEQAVLPKTILKIATKPERPRLIFKKLKSEKKRKSQDVVLLPVAVSTELDEQTVDDAEFGKGAEESSILDLRMVNPLDSSFQDERDETRKDKKKVKAQAVDEEVGKNISIMSGTSIFEDKVVSGMKNKRFKILDSHLLQDDSVQVEVLTTNAARSKNRKAGLKGAKKFAGVILESKDDVLFRGRSDPPISSADLIPMQSWGGHSESSRRRRIPSSKFRDMDTSLWRHSKGNVVVTAVNSEGMPEEPEQLELVSKERGGGPRHGATESRKERRRKVEEIQEGLGNFAAADDDSSEAPRKRMKVVDIGGARGDGAERYNNIAVEGSGSKVSLRLKIRKQSDVQDTHVSNLEHKDDEEDVSTIRGQRSKRRRPITAESGAKQNAEPVLINPGSLKDNGGATNDSSILQRLGTDAVSKRVEVFWPIDNKWYKGTVIGVFPQKLQFALRYDDGEEETLEYGKERVRLLSSRKVPS